MKIGKQLPSSIKFVSISAPKEDAFAIHTADKIIHVYEAELIQLISEYLGIPYEVYTPSDGAFGEKLPGGNWTGMIGMIYRSEVDLAMAGVIPTIERFHAVNFSYPYRVSKLTFMADKPVPSPRNSAIFYPFSLTIWYILLAFLIMISLLFYALKNRKISIQYVMLNVFGNLLEKSMLFSIKKPAIRLLACAWLLGIVIITNSYKGLLLSFLSFPFMVGIRNFQELSEASVENSVTCFGMKGSYVADSFLHSKTHSWNEIGECLKKNEVHDGDAVDAFFQYPSRKAFIASDVHLKAYEKYFDVSDDSYYMELFGIPFSKDFCCPKILNTLIHHSWDSGIILKLTSNQRYFLNRKTPPFQRIRLEAPGPIKVKDLLGAFIILISGMSIAFFILLAEILVKKYKTWKH